MVTLRTQKRLKRLLVKTDGSQLVTLLSYIPMVQSKLLIVQRISSSYAKVSILHQKSLKMPINNAHSSLKYSFMEIHYRLTCLLLQFQIQKMPRNGSLIKVLSQSLIMKISKRQSLLKWMPKLESSVSPVLKRSKGSIFTLNHSALKTTFLHQHSRSRETMPRNSSWSKQMLCMLSQSDDLFNKFKLLSQFQKETATDS